MRILAAGDPYMPPHYFQEALAGLDAEAVADQALAFRGQRLRAAPGRARGRRTVVQCDPGRPLGASDAWLRENTDDAAGAVAAFDLTVEPSPKASAAYRELAA